MRLKPLFSGALFVLASVTAAHAEPEPLQWSGWSGEKLGEARAEKKFVILDLEAVWCHWCHVMADTTYRDSKVVELLKSKYVTIRVDQDANPDLASRYGDWGWPATIIFAPDGSELVKRRGYIPPEQMASLLQAVIDDPTPGPSVTAGEDIVPAATSSLSASARQKLMANFEGGYDKKNGGWGDVHKFIDPDGMDLAIQLATTGDKAAEEMARQTLDRATAIIDPVWGGIYQYSDAEDWSSPHFEKIMWFEANGLRQYALASALFKEPRYRQAADQIYKYLSTSLLSPEGAFYATQDADVDAKITGHEFYKLDDAGRRKLGRQPRIDPNLFARENGWAISALVAYSSATSDSAPLALALKAADWVLKNRQNADGTLRHGEKDRGGPFLGDAIAFGNAALDLYAATGDRKWLDVARRSGETLGKFRDAKGGFVTSLSSEGKDGALAKSYTNFDEQVQTARFATKLWRYLGNEEAKSLAEHAMKFLGSDGVVASGRNSAGALLADYELAHEPTHITVVGHKDDAAAAELHKAALTFPATIKRIDWWDKREGSMTNADVTYPELDRAAAFACSNRLCSLPAFSAAELTERVSIMTRPAKKAASTR